MKILLINSNPVVSRLTALSAKKENIELDEIKDISELKNNNYNIVFVDIDSFNEETAKFLKNSNIKKRVCFYTQDNRDIDKIFNFEILKPFLPSEVSSIIRNAKIELEEESFDLNYIEKSKDDYMNLDELISNKKDNLDLELETITSIKKEKKIELDKEIQKPNINKEKITKDELFVIDDTPSKGDNSELFTVDTDKKIDKIEDELLNFDEDSKNEVTFDSEIKKGKNKDKDSTKILDKNEINNIKSLLNNETFDSLSLDDIIESSVVLEEPKIESKKKKKKKVKKIEKAQTQESKVAVDVITDTIKTMPVEELRQLLRGTKIHITIEFPNNI
ncbi:MAG: hypothetical protein KAU90_03280 [Sulfurovaceae bacterium]|nr:hypothetical protein [Sulfurovaceae bacterium]